MGEPLGVIAGAGRLPLEVAAAARRVGRHVIVIAIAGEADADLIRNAEATLSFGQIGRLLKILRANGVRDLVLIGGIGRRPDFALLWPDFGTLKRLPKIMRIMVGGDRSLLASVIRLFEDEGFHMIGADTIAPHLRALEGRIAGPPATLEALADARLAARLLQALDPFETGQAAVVVAGRAVAVEGVEGTDAVLMRVSEARRAGRLVGRTPQGALLKRPYAGQDRRVDLPAIGPETVRHAAAAGLQMIAVAAGEVLIAEQTKTAVEASRLGIAVVGLGRMECAP